jgi:CRP-like cAMP-binding protein
VLSFLAAFGAGALITALTIELVAPQVLALSVEDSNQETLRSFWALIIGLPVGGILFVLLDQLLNAHGGFLRKTASILNHFRRRPHLHPGEMIEELSRVPILSCLDKERVQWMLDRLHAVRFVDQDHLYSEGKLVHSLFLIRKGSVRIRILNGNSSGSVVGPGEALGLFALMSDSPALATAVADGTVESFVLKKPDFDRLRELCPRFDAVCRELASERLEAVQRVEEEHEGRVRDWINESRRALARQGSFPAGVQLREVAQEHENAPLAIWLGILLDGIPESLILGSGLAVLLHESSGMVGELRFLDMLPYTLIAGLFLSNFPEALYSSANMKKHGLSSTRVLGLWTSLMIMTGIGAGFGYLLAGTLPHTWFNLFEGIAAGAMLTMIASTMIPEAVHLGSANIVGLSTLAGFVVSLLFKLLE